MTTTAHGTLQAALSAFAGEGGSRVLVAWQRVQRGLSADGLDDVETARVARLRREQDRDRYLTAHHAARRVAGEWIDCPPDDVVFDRTCGRCGEQHGAPTVVGPAGARPLPSVSLTHSGDVVGVALGLGGPVGLDVEQPWPDDGETRLAGMVRAPGDADGLALRDLWVCKEAVLKAAGVGLAVSMTELALSGGTARGTASLNERHWWYELTPAPLDFAAAVAGLGSSARFIHAVRL